MRAPCDSCGEVAELQDTPAGTQVCGSCFRRLYGADPWGYFA
jgi:hypothetical protein